MSSTFERKLEIGKVAESAIAKWLIARGNHVLPAYEIIDKQFAGPRLFGNRTALVVPDMLVFSANGMIWIEAKHKSAFTKHRITDRFVTGIDKRHWHDYLQVSEVTRLPCYLMFNHKGGPPAKDSPPGPTGLYSGEIQHLKTCINHEHDNWGKGGMVYWAERSLTRLGEHL